MRLWHKNLIKVLPRKQLLSQWRECCCIAKLISESGTPNHILVNKIMDYDISHFVNYTELVISEMNKRGWKINTEKFYKYFQGMDIREYNIIFFNWHNFRYLTQCFYNLQEKYNCGGISDEEWDKIKQRYDKYANN